MPVKKYNVELEKTSKKAEKHFVDVLPDNVSFLVHQQNIKIIKNFGIFSYLLLVLHYAHSNSNFRFSQIYRPDEPLPGEIRKALLKRYSDWEVGADDDDD